MRPFVSWSPCLIHTFVPEISPARANAGWMDHRPAVVRICGTEEEADRLLDLLRAMFVLDPAERPSVRQVMETHSWLVVMGDNLPSCTESGRGQVQ
jgi:hypothetical protein